MNEEEIRKNAEKMRDMVLAARAQEEAEAKAKAEAEKAAAATVNEPVEVEAATIDNDTLTAQYQNLQNDSAPDAEGKGEGAGEGEGAQEGQERGQAAETIKKKFRVKLDRLARLVAEAEKAAYMRLKAPYKDEYFGETLEDTQAIIETRFEVVSEYGDILNLLVFDFVGHAVDSAATAASNKTEKAQGESQAQGAGQFQGGNRWF